MEIKENVVKEMTDFLNGNSFLADEVCDFLESYFPEWLEDLKYESKKEDEEITEEFIDDFLSDNLDTWSYNIGNDAEGDIHKYNAYYHMVDFTPATHRDYSTNIIDKYFRCKLNVD